MIWGIIIGSLAGIFVLAIIIKSIINKKKGKHCCDCDCCDCDGCSGRQNATQKINPNVKNQL